MTKMSAEEVQFYSEATPLPPGAEAFQVFVQGTWDQANLAGNMADGKNEFSVVTRPTKFGWRIMDVSLR